MNTHLAFIKAGWHEDIVDQARQGFLDAVADAATVETFEVPGSFELPLHAQLLARSQRFDAIVVAGFVVDGGVYRHDFVAHAVISGLMRVQLDTDVPVFTVVLTPHHFHEHAEHETFFRNHMATKGNEAAKACLATLRARRSVLG